LVFDSDSEEQYTLDGLENESACQKTLTTVLQKMKNGTGKEEYISSLLLILV
jgi:hypothetical protein